MINHSVKTRAFLISFIPMLLITSILSVYFIRSQLTAIDNTIDDRGISMSMHLANASEFGLFSGNIDSLSALLHSSTMEEGVESISIWDNTGDLVIRVPADSAVNTRTSKTIESRVFRQPILLRTTSVSDVDDPLPHDSDIEENDVLGWIDIEISTIVGLPVTDPGYGIYLNRAMKSSTKPDFDSVKPSYLAQIQGDGEHLHILQNDDILIELKLKHIKFGDKR